MTISTLWNGNRCSRIEVSNPANGTYHVVVTGKGAEELVGRYETKQAALQAQRKAVGL
jgi:hypothetical protein